MKFTIHQLAEIHAGLLDLDGLQKPGSPDGAAVFVPHKYSGKFTLRRVTLIHVVKARLREFEEATESLRKQHRTGEGAGVDKEKAAAFGRAFEEMKTSPIEVDGLRTFKLSDLNLYDPETNPKGNVLAASILERVLPLIEDELDPMEEPEATNES